MVNEFPDVFLEELPGMPPDRDIEFVIELKLGAAPIYRTPFAAIRFSPLRRHLFPAVRFPSTFSHSLCICGEKQRPRAAVHPNSGELCHPVESSVHGGPALFLESMGPWTQLMEFAM
jgi:hypothetical protein